jgi:Tfp pilus assembly PilM family ATPase
VSIFQRLRRNKTDRAVRASARTGLIGLDIGTHSLRLCQLREAEHNCYTILAKNTVGFEGSRQQLLESPAEFKRLVARALKGKPFKGRKVTAIMPPDEVRIIMLTYKASVPDIDAEILNLLESRLDGDIDDYVVDYLPVRNNKGDDEHIVLASVAPRDKVWRLLNLLQHAGLHAQSLDIGPSALKRLIGALYLDKRESNVLVINVGDDESYLTIISGRRLLFDQPVHFGCIEVLQEISQTLEISQDHAKSMLQQHGVARHSAQAGAHDTLVDPNEVAATLLEIVKPKLQKLVEEINRVLVYAASETHGEPLSRVCLLGSIARWPGVEELILSFLDVQAPSSQQEFYEVFLDASDNTEPWYNLFPDMAIAVGLALRGLYQNRGDG